MTRGNEDAVEQLTEAQREALRLVMAGYQSKEIARELGIGVDAVNKRLAAAKTLLGAPTRFAAARQLAAFETRETSHSLVGQSLAVETGPVAAPPFVPSRDKGWGDDQPQHDNRVADRAGDYVVVPATVVAPSAADDRGPSVRRTTFDAGQLFATPLRVFIVTLVVGIVGALVLRA